jgi:hypothetical protein
MKGISKMEQLKPLATFFSAIANDPRIGVSHISLYCALLQNCDNSERNPSISVVTKEIMKAAKISGLGTYHKCIRDLHEFGYLQYRPSYNHRKKNRVSLCFNAKQNYPNFKVNSKR